MDGSEHKSIKDVGEVEVITVPPGGHLESGVYANGIKVRDLHQREIDEIKRDHIQGDVDDQMRNED